MKFGETEVFYIYGGIVQACLGSFLIFFIYCFASMVDPGLTGWDWWGEVFVHIGSGGGWPVIGVGALLAISGLILVIRGIRITRQKPSKQFDPLEF
jgi:hypothetical protein